MCVYTFWEYTRGAWGRDAGLRIDHLLLNAAAARRLAAAGVDRDVRGWGKTSDHAPAWIELRATDNASSPQTPRATAQGPPRPGPAGGGAGAAGGG